MLGRASGTKIYAEHRGGGLTDYLPATVRMRVSRLKRLAVGGSLALALGVFTNPAQAIDVEPGDYYYLGDGANLFLGYYQRIESNTFNLDGNEVPGSEFSGSVGALRYLRYTEAFGLPAVVQGFFTFADFSDADFAGGPLVREDGFGDITLGFTMFAKAAALDDPKGTTLGFTLYTSFPTGDYTVGGANLGAGGVTFIPQVGLIQGLGGGWFFEANYDVAITRDFTANGVSVDVDPRHQTQLWIRKQFSQATYAAIGFNAVRGADISANGVATGLKTNVNEARISVGTFINPTTQISGRISYDIGTDDGFSSEPFFQLRLLKLF